MSAFHRFIFCTFLILALGFLGVSSALAATYTYYQSGNQCNLVYGGFCSQTFNAITNPNKEQLSCTVDATNVRLSYKTFKVNTVSGAQYDVVTNNPSVASVMKHTCAAGEKFELIGCTPRCVPETCADKVGQRKTLGVRCGTVTCAAGVTVKAGSSFTCSQGVGRFTPLLPSTKAYFDGCELESLATSSAPYTESDGKAFEDELGSNSVTMYCSQEYEVTATETSQPDTESTDGGLSFYDAVPMPPNGICPPEKPQPSTINGQSVCIPNTLPDDCPVQGEKLNSNGVCVAPDDPTYPDGDSDTDPDTSCPNGEIRNNFGKCVPYADAAKCPAGEIRNNLGTCSPDPKSNTCPQGQVKNNVTGACITDPRGSGCEGNALPDKNGMCPNGKASCPVGMVRNDSGSCVSSNPNKPPEGTGCKDGSTADSNGKCSDGSGVCPVGQVRNIQGKCVVDNTNTPASATASGDCLSAPECSGDIVQCGLMHQQWQSGCDLKKAMTEVPEGGDTKYSEVGTDTNDARVTAAVGSLTGYSNQIKSFLVPPTAGSCPADFSVSVMNHSIVIPLSKACPLFQFMRFLLHLIVNLVCLRILYSSFVRV